MKHQLSVCAFSPQSPPTTHTQTHKSWWAHGCIHLPLSHHNTLFKLDTARSLFFLAELIEPVQPDLPYQSVKGIFHSLQYKTQLASMLRNTGGHTVWVHVLQLTDAKGTKQADILKWVYLRGLAGLIVYINSTQNLSYEYPTLTFCWLEKVHRFLPPYEEGLWLNWTPMVTSFHGRKKYQSRKNGHIYIKAQIFIIN